MSGWLWCRRWWPVAILAASIACDASEDDDFGPPSGLAQVDGRVFTADSVPVGEGAVVSLTLCELPVDGFAGDGRTDSEGRYSVTGELPPIGVMEFPAESDSTSLECELIVDQTFARSGPIQVWFFRRGIEPTVLRLDLYEGPSGVGAP